MRICLAACVGLIALAAAPAAQAAKPADTVLRNGFVYTVDARDSVAEAVAVRNGAIVYVGSDKGARRFTGPDTRVMTSRAGWSCPAYRTATSTTSRAAIRRPATSRPPR